jgi:hypothetical protein
MAGTHFVRSTLLAVALAVPGVAQQITGGDYKVTQVNGDPVRPGVEVRTVLIPPILGSFWWGLVYVSRDGGPFTLVEPECFSMVVGERGVGYWVNNQGSEGHIDPQADDKLKSTVDTGPNQGTERLMTKKA